MAFISQIIEKSKHAKKTIVLPEATDERVLKAAEKLTKEKIAKVILLGNPDVLKNSAAKIGVNLGDTLIIEPKNYKNIENYITTLVEKRAKKGMTHEKASEILKTDVNFFGAMMVAKGDADGMVSGSDSPTSNVLRAALQVVGTKADMKTVSSLFIMELKDKIEEYGNVLLFGDCAVIPFPTSEQLADIAISAAQTARNVVGVEPKVALMTFSTKGSAKHDSVDVVREAGKILEQKNVDFEFEAELQADAAIVRSVGIKKAPESKVAGYANTLIFPNLASGNIGYKLVQRLAGAEAHGPLLQGLAAPINDLSRGCSVSDIVNLAAITSMQVK